MSKTDKIIEYFRNLREESVPTMNTSTPNGSAGFSANADASGPNAGNTFPFMKFMRRRKDQNQIDYRSVPNNYKKWVKTINNK
jgi:hypothetical protein